MGHDEQDEKWCKRWSERSVRTKVGLIAAGVVAVPAFLALFGAVTMWLWNWLMPEIFGLKPLGYWQAWGLLALCTILFKGLRLGGSGNSSDRKRRKHLRRYIREDQPPAGESPAASAASATSATSATSPEAR